MTNDNEVRIIGFITNPIRDFSAPVPDNYLQGSELPKSLINELKTNGWQDPEGTLWWDPNFRPDPVKGKDGNVYLLVGDVEMNFASGFQERLREATKLLTR